jgi:sensor histidine kinase YesM
VSSDQHNRPKEYLRGALIALIGSPLLTYISCTSCASNWDKFISTATVSAAMWFVMWVGHGELAHYLNVKISWVTHPVRRFVVGVITTVLFTVAVAILMLRLWEWSQGFRFKSYSEFIVISLIITFIITLFLHGREFLVRWRQTAVEAERYQKESIKANFEALKSQVNPHFLFNSLNVLTSLVYQDADKAARFIKKLSEVYRYVLDTQNQELVSLSDELAFVESYVYLQQIRFGDNLKVELPKSHDGKVIPLSIQMLLENAIKHNEVSSENPLTISVKQEGDYLVVENNVRLKSAPLEENSGLGLTNIQKRYEFLSDKLVVVTKSDSRFEVKIPILNS